MAWSVPAVPAWPQFFCQCPFRSSTSRTSFSSSSSLACCSSTRIAPRQTLQAYSRALAVLGSNSSLSSIFATRLTVRRTSREVVIFKRFFVMLSPIKRGAWTIAHAPHSVSRPQRAGPGNKSPWPCCLGQKRHSRYGPPPAPRKYRAGFYAPCSPPASQGLQWRRNGLP